MLEEELHSSVTLEKRLTKELSLLRRELDTLKKEKPSKEILAESTKLESTIGTVLLDLAEEIPLAGKAVKWFRSWMKSP
jgi:hypothetical protein